MSWFQPEARVSHTLVERTGLPLTTPIIDVGGGASVLASELLDMGYADVTVLDISAAALAAARAGMGDRADAVTWIEADILEARLADAHYGLWHDRAAFHFLTDPADRARYREKLEAGLRPGGYAIVATFAADGPQQCSGLNIVRYSPEALAAELGPSFRLIASDRDEHRTPAGAVQPFTYGLFRR